MPFKVFISHSVAPRELGIVYAVVNEAAKKGASPFIPDRDWNPEGSIPERIQTHVKETEYMLAIATNSGFQLKWLNREVKEGLKRRKSLIIIADKGIRIPPEIPSIRIDRDNPAGTIRDISGRLAKFGRDKKTKEILTWITIGALLFLLLFWKEK
ncbi:MAG: TIR domain-containing protein [candidate division WOR-3 bacterium]